MILFLAQAATPNSATTDLYVQYGAFFIMAAVAFGAVRVLYARDGVARDLERAREADALDVERKRRDALEIELRELNRAMQDKIVPVLTEATRAISELLRVTQERDRQ